MTDLLNSVNSSSVYYVIHTLTKLKVYVLLENAIELTPVVSVEVKDKNYCSYGKCVGSSLNMV